MAKVSVCMATYNGEKHVVRQISSILKQLGLQDELVISDDKSTDKTCELIKSIQDNRIRFYTNKGIAGPVGNFQNVLSLATGDFIFLCDQDDVWLPNKVSETVKLLKTYDLVLSDCTIVDEQLNVLDRSFFKKRGSTQGLVHNFFKNSYMGCCMAFRKNVLTYALPFPTAIYMHDWWIGLLAEIKGTVYFHPVPLILYVRHGSNASPTGEGSYGWLAKLRNRIGLFFNVLRRLIR